MILEADHYLYRLRTSCLLQPALNWHQLVALDHTMAQADWGGDFLELMRAGSLDRAANLVAAAVEHDDPWLAAAARVEYLAALQGGDATALMESVISGVAESALLRAQSTLVMSSIERLFLCLLRSHISPLWWEVNWVDAREAYGELSRLDPAFCREGWAGVERYVKRLPWGVAVPLRWLEVLWRERMEPLYPLDQSLDVEKGRKRWLSGLRRYEGAWPEVALLEMGEVLTFADTVLERQAVWPDEALANFAVDAKARIQAAATPIAREAIAGERSLAYGVLASRNTLWLTALLAPLSEAGAAGLSQELCRYEPGELLALPRVKDFLERNIAPQVRVPREDLGTMQGEGGYDLLRKALNGES